MPRPLNFKCPRIRALKVNKKNGKVAAADVANLSMPWRGFSCLLADGFKKKYIQNLICIVNELQLKSFISQEISTKPYTVKIIKTKT